jgi:LEA14-like dessication related protein
MRYLSLPVILPLVLISLACSSVKQPTATFKGVNVTELTPQGFALAFDLNVQNPNPVALPVSGANYKLGFGGVNVLEGKAKPNATLPANGNTDVRLPVTVTFDNLLAAEKAIVSGGGNLPYSLTGDVSFDAGSGGNVLSKALGQSPTIPLKYEGTLDVKKLLTDPKVLESPAAKKLAAQLLGGFFNR